MSSLRSARSPFDWLAVVDVKRALVNCHKDLIGDWYRDPWSWPELSWVVDKRPDMLVARLNAAGVQRAANLDVPKENFATRPAIVMDPIDRLTYQALVDRVSAELIGSLPPWVYGWRLPRKEPAAGEYSDNGHEYDWYRSRVSTLAGWNRFGLSTDIVSFFANIPIDRICEEVAQRAGVSKVTDRLIDMLQAWSRVAGRSGLPQRSMASAALANMYLRPLDDVLAAVPPSSPPIRIRGLGDLPAATRWMDDIWVFGRDDGRLRAVQLDLEAGMRGLDLNMGIAKTHVLEGDELLEAALAVQHSAADGGLKEDPVDTKPLQDLVERLLARPEEASRTSIKFATVWIRDHKLEQMVQPFVDNANRMPHAADALSRLFRHEERWRDLEEWYVNYTASPWGRLPWAVGQLGTMFPSGDSGRGQVADYFLAQVETVPHIQLLALAAQRTSSWRPDEARLAIREASKRADHPLERRILGLTALSLREERSFVRSLLREFEQNEVTLRMVEDRNFRPFPITSDFK